MISRTTPKFDETEIRRAFDILVGTNVTELRALEANTSKDRYKGTFSGYFDNADDLIRAVNELNDTKGIYIIPNAVDSVLLARAANRIRRCPKGESTQDTNIVRRKWLLIDCDPVRPSGISSSHAEHAAAIQRCREIFRFLRGRQWPDPIAADSSNGAHLLYRVDLAPDDSDLVSRFLQALAAKFDDDVVKVDTGVFNAARIWKLYGTRTCKGDDTQERPHRLSKLLSVPSYVDFVPRAMIDSFAPPPTTTPASNSDSFAAFDIDSFITRHGLEVDGPESWTGSQGPGRKWVFRKSPMCEHHEGAAFIAQHGSGAITAKCHHNSCTWSWTDLRQLLEPVSARRAVTVAAEPQPPAGPKPIVTLQDAALEYMGHLASGKSSLVELGIGDVNASLGGGVAYGEMIIIAARPSHGKTAFALQCLDYCCEHGHAAAMVSEEMSALALGKRMIQFAVDTPEEHWAHETKKVRSQLASHFGARKPCYVVENCRSPEVVADNVKRLHGEHGVDVVAVDYAQLLTSKGGTRYEQITHTSTVLRQLANELKIVLLVLCQMSRSIESRNKFVPQMSDLRESGQLEQDADVILFLVWPHRIDHKQDPKQFQIYVAKNRNRPIHMPALTCEFKPSRQRIVEYKSPVQEYANYDPSFEDFGREEF